MNELALRPPTSAPEQAPPLDDAAFPPRARWVLKLLARAEHGSLDVSFPDGQRRRFGHGQPLADIQVVRWNVVDAALKRGDIGFAESFLAGDWTSRDLTAVLRFFLRNRRAAEDVIYGSVWGGLLYRLRHLLNRNTRAQAKKNIHAHYDLGNAFYALWLDPTMTYSSALLEPAAGGDPFAAPDAAQLEAGQHAKYARVLHQLALPPRARLLEIGCGWGGFAEAAARAGHHVTGLTLSPAQLEYARERLARSALPAQFRWQDYRDETAQYDGIASIEMFEAVGERWWPQYFATLARCLKPGARACIQTIVIDDALFERYRRGTDFIQQYIFPGGMLPAPSAFERHAEAAGLVVDDRFSFGTDYARTLAAWRERFRAQLHAVRGLGFDDRFVRIWELYLAYCEAAFAEGSTDVLQYTLVRP